MIELLLQAERALEMGRIDAAETLYRQVAEADPRNSIAVVGLARVTLERGDELGAYLEARRALVVDPENAAAGRMVQRLEEVMRYRGDPVPAPDGPVEAVPLTAPDVVGSPPSEAEAGPLTPPAEAEPDRDDAAPDASPPAHPSRSMLRRILDRILGRR